MLYRPNVNVFFSDSTVRIRVKLGFQLFQKYFMLFHLTQIMARYIHSWQTRIPLVDSESYILIVLLFTTASCGVQS